VTRRAAVALLFLVTAVAPVCAHAFHATVRFRPGRVEVDAYYADDTPARDAAVTVRDRAGQVMAEGRTDDRGAWHFPAPPPGPYTVTVDAGAGHRKSVNITIPAVLPSEPTGPAQDGVVISDGPTRDEFTRFPWGGVAAGLTVIVLAALGWRAWRRGRRMPT
jgi:hypothetical protein